MEKKQNHLDQLPIASLSQQQLNELQKAEQLINQEGSDIYLIAFEKSNK